MNKTYTEYEVIELFKNFLKEYVGNEGWVHITGHPDCYVNEFKDFISNGGNKETK